MNNGITLPGDVQEFKIPAIEVSAAAMADGTYSAPFKSISHLLSNKPCKRPSRSSPRPSITNESLKRLAAKHPPAAEWLEGDEDRPF